MSSLHIGADPVRHQKWHPCCVFAMWLVLVSSSWEKKEQACFFSCVPEDSTLLLAERYLVAANMHNNEEVLPHFILQLIHLFAVLPPDTAFLSIYESGSKDSTGVPAELSQSCTCLQAVAASIGIHCEVLRLVLIR